MIKNIIPKPLWALAILLLSSKIFAENELPDRLEDCLDKVERIFNKIPMEKVVEIEVAKRKKKIIKEVIKSLQKNNSAPDEADKDEHFYKPKFPKPLSEEYKRELIEKRIKKKFIGRIPDKIWDIIYYYQNQGECLKKNIHIHNRLLLHGKPGTGKTHLIRILSEELEIPVMQFTASFFGDKYIGESSRRIRKAFAKAKEFNGPLFIFIDELDALAAKRKDATHNEHRAALVTLLTELQDLQNNSDIFIFVATNDLGSLDNAIKDRFAGSIYRLYSLSIEEKSELIVKLFADYGVNIDKKFAKRLAEVINTTTVFNGEVRTFSNRDIENLVVTTLFKQYKDKKQSSNNPQELCLYARQSLDSMDSDPAYSYWTSPTYCNGI